LRHVARVCTRSCQQREQPATSREWCARFERGILAYPYTASAIAITSSGSHDCELVFGSLVPGEPVLWTCVQLHFQSNVEGTNDLNLLKEPPTQ
jgi:hypothetical protein